MEHFQHCRCFLEISLHLGVFSILQAFPVAVGRNGENAPKIIDSYYVYVSNCLLETRFLGALLHNEYKILAATKVR